MESKHTPGPWSVTGNEIIKAKGIPMLLATVNNSEGAKLNGYDTEANAKLIAAAPELLWSLKQLLSMSEDAPILYKREVRELATKAIKKATE